MTMDVMLAPVADESSILSSRHRPPGRRESLVERVDAFLDVAGAVQVEDLAHARSQAVEPAVVDDVLNKILSFYSETKNIEDAVSELQA